MDLKIKLFLLLICSPCLLLCVHIVASRCMRGLPFGQAPQVVAIGCVIAGNIPVMAILWFMVIRYLAATPHELIYAASYCIVVYNALACIYFHFFNMSETARRIKIMSEAYYNKALRVSELTDRYSLNDILSVRLKRLIEMKQAVGAPDGKYILNRRAFYHISRAVHLWSKLIRCST